MKSFILRLQAAAEAEEMTGVTSFVGEDGSGSFGILAGHDRLMTSLCVGLARFRAGDGHWTYLAVPGGVLYFHDNVLMIYTRRYLVDDDYTRISRSLKEQLLAEEEQLRTIKESLHHMEEEVLRRLWKHGRKGVG